MRPQPDIIEELVLAEASAWLARLQGPARTAAAEAAFKSWLAADASHARAFTRVTDTWDIIPGAARLSVGATAPRARRPRQRLLLAAAACFACLLIAGAGSWFYLRDPVYRTAIGEQRTVTLSDGSYVTLNTDTELTVSYRKGVRRLRLHHGEAMFDVAKNPQRPFIVQTSAAQVRALGTVFDVRSDPDRIAVYLIKGRVEVSQRKASRSQIQLAQATVLSPGERITLSAHAKQILDRPNAAEITAWRQGEVMFDNATLAEAIAELDRYGDSHVQLGDPALAPLRVSGVFAIRDPGEFASTIAQLHGLKVARSNGRTLIER
ncbi:MAG TPA: FecR family protein [Rhodanobacter sp.]|jgi:transmembrane sensor|nr:FecR family protein [Rhodanobacter sp.]